MLLERDLLDSLLLPRGLDLGGALSNCRLLRCELLLQRILLKDQLLSRDLDLCHRLPVAPIWHGLHSRL